MKTAMPRGWVEKTLADVAVFSAGRTPSRARPDYWIDGTSSGTPWVAISDMRPFRPVAKTEEAITEKALDDVFGNRVVPRGTLLMSFKLTIGRVATLEVDACHNEAIVAIYPKDIDKEYLSYYLSNVDYSEYQDRAIKGQTLNRGKLNSIRIAVPPPPVQQRIAASLRVFQRAIEREEATLAAVMQLRDAALERVFESAGSWPSARLGELATVISKGSSPRWQGFEYTLTGVLFVRSQNVGRGMMDLGDRVFLPLEWNEKEKRSVLQAGDVLVNLVGASIGRAAMGGQEIEGANCNQAVAFVRLKSGALLGEYLVAYLLSSHGQHQIHSNKKDIARANLSLEDIRLFSVPVPPVNLQKQIARVLSIIGRNLIDHSNKLEALEETFSALRSGLLTGDISAERVNL